MEDLQSAGEGIEGTDFQQDVQQARRDAAARAGYIAWRMLDVPSVYTSLMPYTCDANELWEGEKAIRRQIAVDLKMLNSPWRKIGPRPELLDFTNLTGMDRAKFGFEIQIGCCMPAAIKRGFENHPDVNAAWALAAEQPLAKVIAERSELGQKVKWNSTYVFSSDAEREAAKARYDELCKLQSELEAAEESKRI